MPVKMPAKMPAKQALKLTPATLILSAAPLAGSTRFINNTCACLYIINVTPKVSAANKYKKLFAPPPLGPLKFN